MKKGDILQLAISSLAFGGSGIGRVMIDEKPFTIFVEDTVPGDVVKVRIGTKKKKYAYGYVVSFVERSSQRVVPHCRHFGSFDENGVRKPACGGCALQFLSYEDQLKIKEQHVRDAITRIGGLAEGLVKPIIGVKEPWFYRNKMEFSFSFNREGRLDLGLHLRRMHHDVIELQECFLMNSYIGELVQTIREFFRGMKIQPPSAENREAALKSLIVREGKYTGEIMVNLVMENGEEIPEFIEPFEKLVIDFFQSGHFQAITRATAMHGSGFSRSSAPKLASLYFTNIINRKGSPKKLIEKNLWGDPVIHDLLHLPNGHPLHFQISPQAFFQPNTCQAEVLYKEALKAAQLSGQETVFDLFCGAGTIGIFCSSFTKRVVGIELNESAIENARHNAKLNNIENIEFFVGDVGKLLSQFQNDPHRIVSRHNSQKNSGVQLQPDIIIVDPPRNGLEEKVVDQVAAFSPKRIVYVSCSPPSLARDLKLFQQKNYQTLSVQPADMFPQTYHIECVAALQKC